MLVTGTAADTLQQKRGRKGRHMDSIAELSQCLLPRLLPENPQNPVIKFERRLCGPSSLTIRRKYTVKMNMKRK